jgi:tetratricopeptide (TPR) repeat protein
MGFLSGVALNYATSAAYDIVKSTLPRIPASLKNEIDKSFEHALRRWSSNTEIRKSQRRELRKLLEDHYLNKEDLRIKEVPESARKFLVHFEEALYNNPIAYKFFKDIKSERSLQIMLQDFKELKEIIIGIEKNIISLSEEKESTGKLSKYLSLNVPRRSKKDIIGRRDELESLRKTLLDGGNAVLINGMGGIGKTTVAQTYLDTYSDEYSHVVWIEFGENESFRSSLVNTPGLMEELGISKEGTLDQMFTSILVKLGRIEVNKPCLLVLDNANNMSGFINMLPKYPQWHILATSRVELRFFTSISLGFLSKKDAFILFNKFYSGRELNKRSIKILLSKVEYHTLAIEILAKMASERNYSFEVLSNALGSDLMANVDTNHSKDGVVKRITSYMCSIFDLSDLSQDENRTLKQLVTMPAGFINIDSIATIWYKKGSAEYYDFHGAISKLVQKGWLNLAVNNGGQKKIQLHQVIRDVLTKVQRFSIEDFELYITNLSRQLAFDDTVRGETSFDTATKAVFGTSIVQLGEYLVMYLDTLFERTELDQVGDFSHVMNGLGNVYKELGEFGRAEELLKRVVSYSEEKFGSNHPVITTCYSNLAMVYRDLGKFEDALELLEKGVRIIETNNSIDSSNDYMQYSNLSLIYSDMGMYEKAKQGLIKAIEYGEEIYDAAHPKMTVLYSNLALVHQELGDYQQAKKILERVIISDEKNFGKNHPYIAINYSNLAMVLRNLGDFQHAKVLLERAMDLDLANFGTDHPTTALSYYNLGLVLQDLQNYKEAKRIFTKTLWMAQKNFGKNHPTTANCLLALGTNFYFQGKSDKAKVHILEAYSVFENVLGISHPRTKISLGYLLKLMNED